MTNFQRSQNHCGTAAVQYEVTIKSPILKSNLNDDLNFFELVNPLSNFDQPFYVRGRIQESITIGTAGFASKTTTATPVVNYVHNSQSLVKS